MMTIELNYDEMASAAASYLVKRRTEGATVSQLLAMTSAARMMRNKRLSAGDRSAIASHAARARWRKYREAKGGAP